MTCPITQLPSYNDDEVQVFHPIMEAALNDALNSLELTDYEVEHHLQMGLIPDFVIRHRETKKWFLVIEVKRRSGDVASTRYRNQAKNYITEAGNTVERPYYALTNLEITDLFYYDTDRPTVSQQIIEPSTLITGDFESSNPKFFYAGLVEHLIEILEVVFNGTPNFINQLGNLLGLLRESAEQGNNWHGAFIPACYEYIKGSLNQSPELRQKLQQAGWRNAIDYRAVPNNLLTSGLRFNFSSLFDQPEPEAYDMRPDIWDVNILQECHEAGQKRRTGEDISDIVFSLIGTGREYDGVVMTDPELARLLAVLARFHSGVLSENDKVLDPAAGLGELLVSATQVFEAIEPNNLVANEIEEKFKEVLSLRLGLSLPHQVSPDNSPVITIEDLLNLPTDFFGSVKVVLLNPPYRRGTDAIPMKKSLFSRIQELTGVSAKLDVGQLGYEWAFLEAVVANSAEGTTFAAIMPERLLFTKSDESAAVRHFLLSDFGLQMIASYPQEKLFDSVIKKTMIIVGKKGDLAENISHLNFSIAIEGVNTAQLLAGLEDGAQNPISFTSNDMFERSLFADNLQRGWSALFDSRRRAQTWISDHLGRHMSIRQYGWSYRRGPFGNQGCSNLLWPNSKQNIWNELEGMIPCSWLICGIRRVKEQDTSIVSLQTTNIKGLHPPISAFQEGTQEHEILLNIINTYLEFENYDGGTQKKNIKTPEEVLKILRLSRNKITRAGNVLFCRNLRRNIRAFLLAGPTVVSTNVFQVDFSDKSETEQHLLLGWFKSIFSFIQVESSVVNQEGTGKGEKDVLLDLLVPDFELLDPNIKAGLAANAPVLEFLDLQNLEPNNNDRLWSEILFGENAQEALESATEILSNLVADRGR